MTYEVAFANWNAVAFLAVAAVALSLIWFKAPKKSRAKLLVVGAALVALVFTSGLMCLACETRPVKYIDSNCNPCSSTCKQTWVEYCEENPDVLSCKGKNYEPALCRETEYEPGCKQVAVPSCPYTSESCSRWSDPDCVALQKITRNDKTETCYTSSEIKAKYDSCKAAEAAAKEEGRIALESKCDPPCVAPKVCREYGYWVKEYKCITPSSARDPEEECEDERARMIAKYDKFITDQRAACSSSNGITFTPGAYTCMAFYHTKSFSQPQSEDCPVDTKYLSATLGCCIGGPIKLTSELTTDPIPSGNSAVYRELAEPNTTYVSIEIPTITENRICMTRFYLCTQATITDDGLVTRVTCEPEDTIYCPNGCEDATCVGPGYYPVDPEEPVPDLPEPAKASEGDYYMLAYAIILISALAVFLLFTKRGKELRKRYFRKPRRRIPRPRQVIYQFQ
jgi:hypothetical protein